MGAAQDLRLGDDHAGRRQAHIRAQGTEALDVLVDRPQADITSARQGDGRVAVPSQQGTDQVIGSADLAHIFVVHDRIRRDAGPVDPVAVPVDLFHMSADRTDRLEDRADITHLGHIFKRHGLTGHDRGCQNAQCRVLGTRYLHFAAQGISTLNNIMFHRSPFIAQLSLPASADTAGPRPDLSLSSHGF